MHIREGEGLAINAGDLALSLVTGTVVHDPGLDDAIKLRVLAELVDMTTRTIEGQALDIGWARDDRFDLTVEDYLLMANHKTAYYSGAVPLAVGAIVGGGSETQIETLRAFGMATGLAFQIQDDVLNLVGTRESTKKDFRSDITEGKRTLVAVHALQHSERARRLLAILSARETERGRARRGGRDHARGGFDRLRATTTPSDWSLDAKAALVAELPTHQGARHARLDGGLLREAQ